MNDHIQLHQGDLIGLNPEIKIFLDKIRAKSRGPERRQFMAHVVSLMGKGGQRCQTALNFDPVQRAIVSFTN